MSAKKVKQSQLSAAMQMPSRVFTYRFLLSLCFLFLIACSAVLKHSQIGVFILLLMNIVFCADVFLRAAWQDAAHGNLRFAALVCVAVGTGFIYSACNTFLVHPLFGPAAELALYVSFFITLSLWSMRRLVREREKTRVFLKKWDDFLPKSGRRQEEGRQTRMIFASELSEGDFVWIKPGERVPCDGIIEKGYTSIDEQLITGNLLPTAKRKGDAVYAGTLNKSAEIGVRVTAPLAASALMSVVNAVKNGELRRSDFLSDEDKFAGWVLPCLLLVSAGAYAGLLQRFGIANWFYYSGILWTMLSLGAPVSLVFCAGLPAFFASQAAKRNKIRIQRMEAVMQLAQADTVFLDKTGTITYGRLRVNRVVPAPDVPEKDMIKVVVTAEQHVEGSFAQAVKEYAREHDVAAHGVSSVDVCPGFGVRARIKKDSLYAGRAQWLTEQGVQNVQVPSDVDETVICVAKNERYLGYLTLADEIRPGAADMVQFLRRQHKDLILISGDNEASVQLVAGIVGITKTNAGVLPKTKAEIINNMCALGKKVVMVGDGFNDIIALLRADAGIVFASGSNIYNHWVDILIKKQDLYPLIDLFVMHKRLRFATVLNVVIALACSVAWVALLLSRMPQQADYRWTVGGTLLALLLILLNSMRLLKLK